MSTILITGASSGIGKQTAKQLVTAGHTVYCAARRIEKMQDLADEGGHPIGMDVTVQEQVEAGVARIEEEAGGVEVLINNAGFGLYGSVEETTIDDARYQFEVNMFGLARVTQLVLPGMRAKGAGKIINVSSMGGKMYTPMGAWYHATKHALEGWSDCLRLELAEHGIQVVVIEPGAIATEFGDVISAPMLKRSGSGPYADLANKVAKATKEAYENGDSSPPEVIGDVIVRAVASSNPSTRYAAGKHSWLIRARSWMSDSMFDRLLMAQF